MTIGIVLVMKSTRLSAAEENIQYRPGCSSFYNWYGTLNNAGVMTAFYNQFAIFLRIRINRILFF